MILILLLVFAMSHSPVCWSKQGLCEIILLLVYMLINSVQQPRPKTKRKWTKFRILFTVLLLGLPITMTSAESHDYRRDTL